MSESETALEDKAHADIGIVCALPIEMATFLDRCERVRKYTGGSFTFRGGRYDDVKVAVAEAGMGFARARDATLSMIEAHSPPWVLSCGFSGGLRPEMKIGHIAVATAITDTHGNELSVDMEMPADPENGLHVGKFVVTDEFVRFVSQKKQLAEEYDAIAVDMESLAVGQVCAERKTRFLAVRAVSDNLSADLPSEVLSVVGETGTMRLGAAMGALWKRPGSIKDLWRLRENAIHAAGRLASFLDGVVAQLYKSHH